MRIMIIVSGVMVTAVIVLAVLLYIERGATPTQYAKSDNETAIKQPVPDLPVISTPVARSEAVKGSRLYFLRLLEDEKYSELDKELIELQEAFEKDHKQEMAVERAFSAFENSSLSLEDKLIKWHKLRPASFAAHVALGNYYYHLGWTSRGYRFSTKTKDTQMEGMRDYFQLAVATYAKALKLRDNLIVPYVKMISVAMTSCDKKGMKLFINKAASIYPGSYLLHSAVIFALQPKWCGSKEAIKVYLVQMQRFKTENPSLQSFAGYDQYTDADIVVKDCNKSVKILDKLIRSAENPIYYNRRGDKYYCSDNYGAAIADFTKALELYPENPTYLIDRAFAYYYTKNYQAAMADLDEALLYDRYNPKGLRLRGRIKYKMQEDYPGALQDYKDSLVFYPYSKDAHAYMGFIYYIDNKDYQSAAAHLSKATELKDNNPNTWFYLSSSYYYLKSCDFINSAKNYLNVCKNNNCKRNQVDWMEKTMERLKQGGTCP